MTTGVARSDVLGFRVRAQQLDRASGALETTHVLDIGVQDTGPDGGPWALVARGVDVGRSPGPDLVMVWTVRGAPHYYRRADLPAVAAAVAPYSDADAGKRIFDASKPLKAAGIGNLEALDVVAAAMRELVTAPMTKGEVSGALTQRLAEPYLRYCRPCGTIHPYEMPFRLAALPAGLELQPGTSPPVLQPMADFRVEPAAPDRFDLVRGYLRLLGPATPQHVAGYVDAPVREVKERWPQDAVEVLVDGERRWALADDVPRLAEGPARVVRLLGPYDLFLQAKDRPLLVDDTARAKSLWPVLGRPGAVLVDGEVAGTWRPRQSGGRLELLVDPWATLSAGTRRAVAAQAERLAAYRGVTLSGVSYPD